MFITAVTERLSDSAEAPHWDSIIQRLYFVDVFAGDVCRVDTTTGDIETVHLDGITSFVIPYRSDPSNLLLTTTRQIRKLHFDTGKSKVLAKLEPEEGKDRFNNGKCDRNGRCWAGTLVPNEEDKGQLYRLDSGYTLTSVADKFTLSNGLAWSLNDDKFYFVDSQKRMIYSSNYSLEEGVAKDQTLLINYAESPQLQDLGFPYGMTVDVEGKLWVACFDGGCVVRIDPNTRKVMRKISIPAKKVTSCCFGGFDYDILYITTAKCEEDEGKNPQAGAVFAITDLGIRGQPAHTFVD